MRMVSVRVCLILLSILFACELRSDLSEQIPRKPRILHLSFHLGCIKEVEYIAAQLDLDLTSWFILGKSLEQFEGCNSGIEIYNIYPDRAQRIWEKNKDYFNTFDIIWTSDTAPLSRIFLQNDWKKPLIIWICNRFDYFHVKKPDDAYYKQFQEATKKDNVWIASYAPYEWLYAYQKGVHLNTFTIKPTGGAVQKTDRSDKTQKGVPAWVDKKNTLFIYPCLKTEERLSFVKDQCDRLNIKTYSGYYNGPDDIKDFKGVIFFTYGAWQNISMFENFKSGLVHFLPSISFMEELYRLNAPVSGQRSVILSRLYEFSGWYSKEYRDLLVYYDSWQDLKYKVETTDYGACKQKIVSFARKHEQEMLHRWSELFKKVYAYNGEYR